MKTKIQSLTNEALFSELKTLALEERKITLQVLEYLREVEARKLFALRGYGSLFDFVVKELGYSEAAASRRIHSMRCLKVIPEVAVSLETGSLNLSTVAAVQTFIKREEKVGKLYSPDDRRDLLKKMEHKSSRECEKILCSISPVSAVPSEKVRVISGSQTEMKLVLDSALLAKLEQIKLLVSHQLPGASYSELLNFMADLTLNKIDPVRKATRKLTKACQTNLDVQVTPIPKLVSLNENSVTTTPRSQISPSLSITGKQEITPASEFEFFTETSPEISLCPKITPTPKLYPHSKTNDSIPIASKLTPTSELAEPPLPTSGGHSDRFIPALVRRAVLVRDAGRCTFRDGLTGRVCGSQFQVQIDHVLPLALGGGSEMSNLRCLCSLHNQMEAIRLLGGKMDRFMHARRHMS